MKNNQVIKNKYGFTLVEILVSMFILTLIIFIFTPFIINSFDMLIEAGEIRKNVLDAKGDIEKDIALMAGSVYSSIPVNYTGQTAETYKRDITGTKIISSSIQTFISDDAYISITPTYLIEGYYNLSNPSLDYIQMNIIGYNTHFKSTNTDISVVNKNSQSISPNPIGKTINSETSADIYIPVGQLNFNGPYTITISTDLSAQTSKNEIVKATFNIQLPNFIAAGSSSNSGYISPDSVKWTIRSTTHLQQITDIIYGNNYFLGTRSDGKICYISDLNDWASISVTTNSLNDILYTGSEFYTVENGGIIRKSYTGITWSSSNSLDAADYDLNSISYDTNNNLFIATGDNGTVVSFSSFDTWNTEEQVLSYANNINSINYSGHDFIAAGEDGLIISTINASEWYDESLSTETRDFYTVSSGTYIIGETTYHVVTAGGQEGLLYYRERGASEWYECSVKDTDGNSITVSDNINDIEFLNGKFYAVGTNGLFMHSDDGINWVKEDGDFSTNNMTAVTWASN